MALAIFAAAGGRSALARNVLRISVARGQARDVRTGAVVPHRLGLDCAGIATASCDRRALERAGTGVFPA